MGVVRRFDQFGQKTQGGGEELNGAAAVGDRHTWLGRRHATLCLEPLSGRSQVGDPIGDVIKDALASAQGLSDRTARAKWGDNFITHAGSVEAELRQHVIHLVAELLRPEYYAEQPREVIAPLCEVRNDHTNMVETHR